MFVYLVIEVGRHREKIVGGFLYEDVAEEFKENLSNGYIAKCENLHYYMSKLKIDCDNKLNSIEAKNAIYNI